MIAARCLLKLLNMQQNKIDVIVLDHHQSEMQLPKAYSIINPNRLDDSQN